MNTCTRVVEFRHRLEQLEGLARKTGNAAFAWFALASEPLAFIVTVALLIWAGLPE